MAQVTDRPRTQETFQCVLDPTTFKALLRDLLFREAGKPYFKGLYVPRPRRFFGRAWRTVSRYDRRTAHVTGGETGYG